jgi:phage shock protein A
MTTLFLEEPKRTLNEIVVPPQAQLAELQQAVAGIVGSFEDFRLGVLLNLLALSHSSDFEEVNRYLERVRDMLLAVIKAAGDMTTNRSCLVAAQELRSSVAAQVTVCRNIERLEQRGGAVGSETQSAIANFAEVTQRIEHLYTEISGLQRRLAR